MENIASTGSEILKAGDYKLESLTIASYASNETLDLRSVFSYIEIYEDLFSPYLTAKLNITDGLNLPEHLPIRGQERVELSFKADIDALNPIKLSFRVYKMDPNEIDKTGKAQKYTLHLISDAGFENETQYCGYSMSGSVSLMVQNIFKKHFDEQIWKDKLFIEQTRDNYSFVLPRTHTPFSAINWLTTRAVNNSSKDYSPFFFYQTVDGYNFRSLNNLIEETIADPMRYFYNTGNLFVGEDPLVGASPESVKTTILPERYHKIQFLREANRFDMIDNIKGGKISSSLVVYDLLAKQMRTVDLYEPEAFEAVKKVGSLPHGNPKDPLIERLHDYPAVVDYMPANSYTVWDGQNNIVDNFNVELLHLRRKYHSNSLVGGQRVHIELFGDSRRRVGQVVNLTVPKVAADSHVEENTDDKNLSGNYMITAIRHTLGTAYTCSFELSKSFLEV